MSRPPLSVLSLGAGVQSTTLALLCERGVLPKPDLAIFADTYWEPAAVYRHLDWLDRWLSFPIHRVSQGDIREAIRTRRKPAAGRVAAIPWHTVNPDGSEGMGRRQCSSEYKLTPIMHEIRRQLGKGPRDAIPAGSVEVLIGISWDERHRMREARQAYMVNRYPLVEQMRWTRQDCLAWLKRHYDLAPPKSACIGCPFHNDAAWRDMRDNRPDEWAEAVEYDRILRTGKVRGLRAVEYMHSARVPLDQVDFSLADRQLDLFGNECEGMCGV